MTLADGRQDQAVSAASEAESRTEEAFAQEIERLAQLSILAYDRERKLVADNFGCRPLTIDAAVKRCRACHERNVQDDIVPAPPAPATEPVDGSDLFHRIVTAIRSHVVLSDEAADAVALWLMHTHLLDAAQTAPRLIITSAEKRSGKTTLLGLLSLIVPRQLAASNITASAVFRVIDLEEPTLLIDEADTFLAKSRELNGVLNSGHTRPTAFVIRSSGSPPMPTKFSTWAPMAIAAIGRLKGTIMDRSIVIRLRRRRRDESVRRLRLDRADHLQQLASQAARWAIDNIEALRVADPSIPKDLHDRAADNWRPLLAIADLAGGEWPTRARKAAVALTVNGADDDDEVASALLHDIQTAFLARKVDRIPSRQLVDYLVELEHRPWAEWKGSRGLTKYELARLLRPLGIRPRSIRLDKSDTPKGYTLSDFEDAFARYLPAPADTPAAGADGACGGVAAESGNPRQIHRGNRKTKKAPSRS